MITIDGKQYDETKFSPELQNYLVIRQEIQVNATRHKNDLTEKIEVLTNHYNAKIVELIKKEAPETEIKKKRKIDAAINALTDCNFKNTFYDVP